jgi:hypothetical protein
MLILIATSCKDFPFEQSKMKLSQLSGNWSGSIKVIQKGTSPFNPSEFTVTTKWVVDNAGNVEIEEQHQTGALYTWRGAIDTDLRINIQSEQLASCPPHPSEPRIYTIELKGQIIKKDGRYQLQSLVDNPICPPTALFAFNYFLQKD